MKQTKLESNDSSTKTKRPVPPPPPLPLPRFWVRKHVTQSVTNQEIAKFWRRKCIEEEDHLLAAIKAAARIRARKLTDQGETSRVFTIHRSYLSENQEDEYMQFEESLKNDEGGIKESNSTAIINKSELNNKDEVRVGIKDWWTKSKYAYLNQPAVGSMEPPKRRASNYVPNCITFKPSPYILHV